MASLSETAQWEDGVYQIETSDPVLGGPNGITNLPTKQLANRTSFLKQAVEKAGSDLSSHIKAPDPHTQYAPKNSPGFTGTPTAPTPETGDNSKKLANTEWVATNSLMKSQNGEDIADKKIFLQNLGIGDSSGYVGRLLNVRSFTKSGTVVKTPGTKKWRIRILGGGGGSSAAPATGAGEVSVSCGGGSGAYAEGLYDVTSITSLPITVGSGGAGGSATSIYGDDGGASSVGSLISAPGGKSGLPAGPASPPYQPVANTNSNAPVGWNILGTSGAGTELAIASSISYAAGSRGANSPFGVGGSIPAISNPANSGGGFGSGASGCANKPSRPVTSGASGNPGIIIIEEYA